MNPDLRIFFPKEPSNHSIQFVSYSCPNGKNGELMHDGSHQDWIYDDELHWLGKQTMVPSSYFFRYDIQKRGKMLDLWSLNIDWGSQIRAKRWFIFHLQKFFIHLTLLQRYIRAEFYKWLLTIDHLAQDSAKSGYDWVNGIARFFWSAKGEESIIGKE